MSYRFFWQLNIAMVYFIEVFLTAEHSDGLCHTGFSDSWTQQWFMSYRFFWQLNTAMVYVIQVFLTAEHSNGLCHTGFSDSWTQHCLCHTGFADTLLSCQQNLYDVHHCCVHSEKTADVEQRSCPKHVDFYFKNKFEKLVHLVSFIIRIYHDARSPERQKIN